MSSSAYLTIRDLTLSYGASVAVAGLNFEVANGEFVSLLGPSGCGKTTTMRAIAGLLQPSAGRIFLGGEDITRVPPNKRDIGLVFQSYALFPHLSVFDNVAFGLKLKGMRGGELTRLVDEALASVGLTGYAKRLPKELSGGQQQRVALARSIVVRPRLLLLDEPLSNLDARLRVEMRAELGRLQRDLKLTMIYVTHDQSEALALSDRVVVMNKGRIEQVGSPGDIYERPQTAFVAQFMGFENIVTVQAGRACGRDGALSDIAMDVPFTTLAWRPAAVVLGGGPIPGTIRAAAYLGQSIEYLVDTPLGIIKAETPASAGRVSLGSEVRIDLPLEKAASFA
ncbi:ABC transporter ATP-binding protein [Roseiarcaceae bacterium H3SJ34-1]|uniref:ABC transporter ATP-binding protein n=1 Tax=Terripilifer ovatus TaxID=3032367 RepID=UPI003AB98372|nr:ABC transporter ATP-binding protein [Roseiarcaceae bacterium H3SJ34-1]